MCNPQKPVIMQKKYNLSVIMKRAWVIYRKHNHQKSWSDSLRESWAIAKNGVAKLTFDHIYDKYYNDVLSYVTSQLGYDRELAEEVVQDLFVRINAQIEMGNYDSERASAKTWLFAIVKNAIRSEYRRKKNPLVHTDGYVNEDGESTFDYACTDADAVETSELGEQLENALASLKERERSVFTLFHYENRKQDEIAELLGLSLSNVKQILKRTKEKLQEMLKDVYLQWG